MRICIIPARGGSKRIPRKNIKNFCGKPMIAYSILEAQKSGLFDKIIVSTDDEEIMQIAKIYGAEAPFVRPKELSDDFTPTIPVIAHAIVEIEKIGISISDACCIYATAPFIQSQHITQTYNKMVSLDKDFAFVATSFAYPIQRAIYLDNDTDVKMFFPEYYNTRSQDLQEAYHDAGQFYWGRRNAWLKSKAIFSEASTFVPLPRYLVQDIDTLEDWQRAELMYKVLYGTIK